jgi:hypothetical protein
MKGSLGCGSYNDAQSNLFDPTGRDFGCVQQSNEDGMPPYLMAVSRTSVAAPHEISFAVGGTMTPIDRRYLFTDRSGCRFRGRVRYFGREE